jgi:hypothetical protein
MHIMRTLGKRVQLSTHFLSSSTFHQLGIVHLDVPSHLHIDLLASGTFQGEQYFLWPREKDWHIVIDEPLNHISHFRLTYIAMRVDEQYKPILMRQCDNVVEGQASLINEVRDLLDLGNSHD